MFWLRRKHSWERCMVFFVERQRNPGMSRWQKTTPGAEVSEVEVDSRVQLEKLEGHQAVELSLPDDRGVPLPERSEDSTKPNHPGPWGLTVRRKKNKNSELKRGSLSGISSTLQNCNRWYACWRPEDRDC